MGKDNLFVAWPLCIWTFRTISVIHWEELSGRPMQMSSLDHLTGTKGGREMLGLVGFDVLMTKISLVSSLLSTCFKPLYKYVSVYEKFTIYKEVQKIRNGSVAFTKWSDVGRFSPKLSQLTPLSRLTPIISLCPMDSAVILVDCVHRGWYIECRRGLASCPVYLQRRGGGVLWWKGLYSLTSQGLRSFNFLAIPATGI